MTFCVSEIYRFASCVKYHFIFVNVMLINIIEWPLVLILFDSTERRIWSVFTISFTITVNIPLILLLSRINNPSFVSLVFICKYCCIFNPCCCFPVNLSNFCYIVFKVVKPKLTFQLNSQKTGNQNSSNFVEHSISSIAQEILKKNNFLT